MTPFPNEERWAMGRRKERDGERVTGENKEVKVTNN